MMKALNISAFAAVAFFATAAAAQDNNNNDGGECTGGLCGTPDQSGGGCGCGCGCSILIAYTDQGDTYQYADDFDDDGIEDNFDNCPFVFNPDQADGDGDGRGDLCDNCPATANFDLSDVDADGLGDLCDPDADGDGIANEADNCVFVPNPGQTNHDTDPFGDACDDNDDNDACPDAIDNCPTAAPDGTNVRDCHDTNVVVPNECFPDQDADGIPDNIDNCINAPNNDQVDSDGDGIGDLCDHDLDNDGLDNTFDNCVNLPNLDQKDTDHDGIGDACDPFLCFVIGGDNAPGHCLDPSAPLQVHAGPTIETITGQDKLLHIFANRESRALKYTWRVTKAPADGDSAYTITNPEGSVSVSQSVEYIYEPDHEARFSTKVPGQYTVELLAELVHPTDDAYPQQKTAQATVTIDVKGAPINSFGCGTTTGATAPAAALLGLLVLVRRRKNKK
jgi:uncharacterized protein (TIGR03382 family)